MFYALSGTFFECLPMIYLIKIFKFKSVKNVF